MDICSGIGEVPLPVDFEAAKREVIERKDLQAAIQHALESGEAVTTGRGNSGGLFSVHWGSLLRIAYLIL